MYTCRSIRNFVCASTIVESQHRIRLVATMHKNWRLDDGDDLVKVCIELESVVVRVISAAPATTMSAFKAYVLENHTPDFTLKLLDLHDGRSCLYLTGARDLLLGNATRYSPCVVSEELP